ncbi:hypothetical protein [Lysinibacillus xylanilyticus]
MRKRSDSNKAPSLERKSTPRFGIMSFILARNGYDGILQKMRDTLKM